MLTFEEFQQLYFEKWIDKRIWAVEEEIGDINTYYEPLGPPGYDKLKNGTERAAYDAVFNTYQFAGYMLIPFSPYLRMLGPQPYPAMPFDVSALEKNGVRVPQDIKAAKGYREFLELLVGYAKRGLAELRQVNPVTRSNPDKASCG